MTARLPLAPLFAAAVGLATAPQGASADDYHYNNMLIGDRASTMGGAYTAVSDDPSGLFYNPSGIVYGGGRNLSASVNAFHSTDTTYKNVLGGDDWNRSSSALLPNYFGVTQPLGDGVAGFSYAVTDAIQENQDTRLTNIGEISEYVINVNNDDNTYKLGPSYAKQITPDLSLGATLYFHYRSSETIFNQVIQVAGGYEWSSSYFQSEEYGVEPVLGLTWSPADRLALGLTLRKTELLSSDTDSQYTCTSDLGLANQAGTECATATPSSSFSTSSVERKYPTTLTAGVAYFPSDRLLFSADATYHGATSGATDASVDSPFRSREATWNIAAGMEAYLNPVWALRTGLYTNNANTPGLSRGEVSQPEHVNMYGLTASLSRFTRSSSITGGIAYSWGSGEAQVVSGDPDIQDVDASAMTFFLSTSYSY